MVPRCVSQAGTMSAPPQLATDGMRVAATNCAKKGASSRAPLPSTSTGRLLSLIFCSSATRSLSMMTSPCSSKGVASGGAAAGWTSPSTPEDQLPIISGAGFILSSDVARRLMSRSSELNRTQPDDVAISRLIQKMEVPMTDMPRTDTYTVTVPALPTDFCNDTAVYQWRLK